MAPALTPRGVSDHATAARQLAASGLPMSDVMQAAIDPRPVTPRLVAPNLNLDLGRPLTPRPVIRGPVKGVLPHSQDLDELEKETAERAFQEQDLYETGKLELSSVHRMCARLDLHVDQNVVKTWLEGLSEAEGITLDDFKEVYKGILAAQTPAVRKSAAGKSLCLEDLRETEDYMRKAFNRHASSCGTVSTDHLRELLQYLSFPDVHGDGYDRFVSEWLLLSGKEESPELQLTVHDFISCVNLLVDVCQRHQEMQ
ncbi:unnamed protein product, partial [Polarella glacialis]